jgi:TolB protein
MLSSLRQNALAHAALSLIFVGALWLVMLLPPQVTARRSVMLANLYSDDNLFLLDLERMITVQVTSGFTWHGTPALSPDGTRVAYVTAQNRITNLHMLDLRSRERRQLTFFTANVGNPAWSPDGNALLFDLDSGNDSGLFIIDSAGGEPRRLTRGSHRDAAWSPDGERIIYVHQEEGVNLWIMNADGSQARPLLQWDGFRDFSPAWSPDGERVALVSNRESADLELYLLDLETRQLTRLTYGAYMDFNPVWTPDGSGILFESWRDGGPGLYLMHIETGDIVRIRPPL